MTAEEFRKVWLKKIGYKDMIELELARISADNMDDIPDDADFAEAYAEHEVARERARQLFSDEELEYDEEFEALQKQVEELKRPLREFLAYYETNFINVSAKDGRVLAALISSMRQALKE
jgi:uncharacterized protein (DUF1800 family)